MAASVVLQFHLSFRTDIFRPICNIVEYGAVDREGLIGLVAPKFSRNSRKIPPPPLIASVRTAGNL